MAKSLNNNHKLTQENTILYMQQEQYNTLNKAIEETRHARHDMRHHLSILIRLSNEKIGQALKII